MTNINAGQRYEENMVHYLYRDLTAADDNNVLSVGWLPDGAYVMSVRTLVAQAFNGTSPSLDVGYRNRADNPAIADDLDGVVDGGSLAAGSRAHSPTTGNAVEYRNGGEIVARNTAANSSNGRARIVVTYTVPNNDPS